MFKRPAWEKSNVYAAHSTTKTNQPRCEYSKSAHETSTVATTNEIIMPKIQETKQMEEEYDGPTDK